MFSRCPNEISKPTSAAAFPPNSNDSGVVVQSTGNVLFRSHEKSFKRVCLSLNVFASVRHSFLSFFLSI